MIRALALLLAMSPVSMRPVDAPRAVVGFEIAWHADVYPADRAPILNAEIIDFDRIGEPPFESMAACEDYGSSHQQDMTLLVGTYLDARVTMRFACERQETMG